MTTNFGAAASDYAKFRAGFPESFFDHLAAAGICRRGATVVDVGTVVLATEQLIKLHNPSWHFDGGNGFHPESVPHLYAAGFRNFETFSYDLDVPYTPEAWRGRIRASAGVGASLEPRGVQAFDVALAGILEESFPSQVLEITHRVFAVLARSPA